MNTRREFVFLTALYLMKVFTILTIMECPQKRALETTIMGHQKPKNIQDTFFEEGVDVFPDGISEELIPKGELVEDK